MLHADEIEEIASKNLAIELRTESDINSRNEHNLVAAPIEHVCKKCRNKPDMGTYIEVLGSIWCSEHFTCSDTSCGRRLELSSYKEYNGEPHCINCYQKLGLPEKRGD